MLPQQRNEATIEAAIERVGKALNAAENSNQRGEDLIVAMANGPELYEAMVSLLRLAGQWVEGESRSITNARAALSKVEGA